MLLWLLTAMVCRGQVWWEEHFLDHRCLSECVNLVLIVPSNQMLDGLRCQRWDEE